MESQNEKINQLIDRLDVLLKRQDEFSKEINILRLELDILKTSETKLSAPTETIKKEISTPPAETLKSIAQEPSQISSSRQQFKAIHPTGTTPPPPITPKKTKKQE